MADSLQGIENRVVFRETFESEQAVLKSGNIPYAIGFDKNTGIFNGSNSYLLISGKKLGSYSIRVRFKSLNTASVSYLYDLRTTSGLDSYMYFNTPSTITGAGYSNIYVNGVETASINSNTKEILIVGVPVNQFNRFLFCCNFNISGNFLNGTIELIEIYSGALTADEVKNLYENKRHRELVLNRAEQLGPEMIDQSSWFNLSYWTSTVGSGWSTVGNTMVSNGTTTDCIRAGMFTIGKTYKTTFTVVQNSGSVTVWSINGVTGGVTGTYTGTFVAGNINLWLISSLFNGSITALSIKEVLVATNTKEIFNVSAINGVIRNKYSGEEYGNNLVSNGGFDADTWWLKLGAVTIADGVCHFSSAAQWNMVYNSGIVTVGKSYMVRYEVKNYVSGSVAIFDTNADTGITRSANGVYYEIFTPSFAGIAIVSRAAGTTLDVDNISIKEVIPSVVNTAVTVVKENDVYAMKFNGTTSKIDCGSYDTLVGDKSFSFWAMINRKGSISHYFVSNTQLIIACHNDSQIAVYSAAGTSAVSSSVITKNTPFHIAVTRTSVGVTNIYINGVLSGTANQSSGTPVAGTSIQLGFWSAYYLKGWMDMFRILDGILTAQEIAQLYSSEKSKYGL